MAKKSPPLKTTADYPSFSSPNKLPLDHLPPDEINQDFPRQKASSSQPIYQNSQTNHPNPQSPPLTDPTAPIITAKKPQLASPETPASSSKPPVSSFPQPKPAAPVKGSQSPASNSVSIVLAFLTIGAVASAVFFFTQSNRLKETLSVFLTTKKNQLISPQDNQPPQETASPTSVTSNPNSSSLSVFPNLTTIINTAQDKVDSAQLIMITVENIQKPDQLISKYWFRESETKKSYFYLLSRSDADLTLFDQQIYVTPDNNIPSLNQDASENRLGIDLHQALDIARKTVIDNTQLDPNPQSISAQFIKTQDTNPNQPSPIWQLSFKYPNRTTPVIVQLDSQTKEVIYTNISYQTSITTTPSPTPSPSPSPTQ